MRSDAWAQYCRAALVRSVSAAAAQFPNPGEEAPKRVHDARRTLKEARAVARLFLHCVGEPARVTIAALAATRRQIGRARNLDVMALRLERLAPSPEVFEPLMAAISRERQAAERARRGLSANAPRARLNAIARRLEQMGLERRRDRGIVAAVARTFGKRRNAGVSPSTATSRSSCTRFAPASSISATSSRYRLRVAGSAERASRRIGRAS